MKRTLAFLSCLALISIDATTGRDAAAAPAPAAPIAASSYALVIGANRGGAGQGRLRFAERDAANVAGVLRSVGRYPRGNIALLSQPTPTELRGAIARIRTRLLAHQRRGEKTSFLFYYSGHARASSLNLAGADLPLPELRRALEELPATLKIVILDACQSGSFSQVKGVASAADFSVNSIASLNASGMAVMASSSGSELSQESDRLGSSYFTHYLLVALRGAGDDNGDGRVTLDEAYRYAYNRTLAATAVTAVGKQHVTLETDLRGKGEIPLSYPASLGSSLLLPRAARGDFLVEGRGSGAVVAEIHKVAGRELRIALAPGAYRVVVRDGDRASECRALVPPGRSAPLRSGQCHDVVLESSAQKGGLTAPTWGFEGGLGFAGRVDDRYTERLGDFGFERSEGLIDVQGHYELTLTRYLAANVHLAATYLGLSGGEYHRSGDTEPEDFAWSSRGLIASARLTYPMLWRYPTGRYGGFIPFVEAGAGVTFAHSELTIGDMSPVGEDHWGYAVSAAAGGQLMLLPAFGYFVKLRYAVAPTIDNLLGDTHDVGGLFFSTGLRTTFR